MKYLTFLLVGAAVGRSAFAQTPAPPQYEDFMIHPSCNSSETFQLRKGFQDAVVLADHAAKHILRYGNASEQYRRYFGQAPSGQVIGWYDKIVHGDRAHALFRCDDPDGNCKLPGEFDQWPRQLVGVAPN